MPIHPQRLNTHIGTLIYTTHTHAHTLDTMDNSYQKHLASVRLHFIPDCMIGSYGFCATPEKEFGGA